MRRPGRFAPAVAVPGVPHGSVAVAGDVLENADGLRAETRDIAEGESASFVYTFTAAGSFQPADHIGAHDLTLELTSEK